MNDGIDRQGAIAYLVNRYGENYLPMLRDVDRNINRLVEDGRCRGFDNYDQYVSFLETWILFAKKLNS